MRARLFVVWSLLPALASAFVSISQALYGADLASIRALQHGNFSRPATATLGFLWTLPESSTDTRGLGGGITWAWNPRLCDDLKPRFREDIFGWDSFLNCQDYKASVARAFDKWSANNRWSTHTPTDR